ncbi:hypothetical protein MJM95_28770, partial [Salmonella enterica subsp. enterica serovar Anatum]|nr:hypothetical protein [Salmonella enterica subsp. enterica serovar Anatum]
SLIKNAESRNFGFYAFNLRNPDRLQPESNVPTGGDNIPYYPLIVDANCHIRLHQQALPAGAHILINDLRIGSQLQDDLYQVWLQS